jgi:hypothetical protein
MGISLVRPVQSLPDAILILYSDVARVDLVRETKRKEHDDYGDLIHCGTPPCALASEIVVGV